MTFTSAQTPQGDVFYCQVQNTKVFGLLQNKTEQNS